MRFAIANRTKGFGVEFVNFPNRLLLALSWSQLIESRRAIARTSNIGEKFQAEHFSKRVLKS